MSGYLWDFSHFRAILSKISNVGVGVGVDADFVRKRSGCPHQQRNPRQRARNMWPCRALMLPSRATHCDLSIGISKGPIQMAA